MKKTKVTLTAQSILQFDAGTHDAVRDGNNLYILMQQEESMEDGGEPEPKEKVEAAKPAAKPVAKSRAAKAAPAAPAEVVDDTERPAPKPAARARAAAPPAPPEPEEEELIPIPEDEWNTLNPNDLVKARLVTDDNDPNSGKIWDCAVVGWKKPKGSKEDKLYVLFQEDGAEDYLRDGDELFEYSVEM